MNDERPSHWPRRCVVCGKPGFGEHCSPECATIATTAKAYDAGYFPPDVSWAELFDGLDQCKAKYEKLGVIIY